MLNVPMLQDGRIDADRLIADFVADHDHVVTEMPKVDYMPERGEYLATDDLPDLDWGKGWQAVYAFALKPEYDGCPDRGRVLKVGLATTAARPQGHVNPKEGSSLVSAIEANPILWRYIGAHWFTDDYRAENWLRDHAYVIVWVLQDVTYGCDKQGNRALTRNSGVVVLERFMRARLGPVYEGTGAFGSTGEALLAEMGLIDLEVVALDTPDDEPGET